MAITTLNNRAINRSDTASAGQVWTATSATAADFQAAGGAWNLLLTTTVSSAVASIEFKHGTDSLVFDNTYNCHVFILSNMRPVTDSQPLEMTWSTDTGSSYLSSNYKFAHKGNDSAANEMSHASASDSVIDLTSDNFGNADTTESGSIQIWCHNFGTTGVTHYCNMQSGHADASTQASSTMSVGTNSDTNDIDAIKFKFGSGNIEAGSISMYGITK
jgi:hypothetical protein